MSKEEKKFEKEKKRDEEGVKRRKKLKEKDEDGVKRR